MPGARKKYNKNRSKRPRNCFEIIIKNLPFYTLLLKFPTITHIFKFLFQNKKQFKQIKNQIGVPKKRHQTDKNT